MKVMVDDGSYYLYLLLQISSAAMITQPLPISMLHHHVVYKSLHVVHFKTHGIINEIHEVCNQTFVWKVLHFAELHASILSVFPKCDQKAIVEKPFICCEYTVHVVEYGAVSHRLHVVMQFHCIMCALTTK